jgi:hypothetical protein
VWAALAAWAARAEPATVHRNYHRAAVDATTGSTIRPIVAARLTETAQPPTDSGAQRAVTLSPIARPAPVSSSAGRAVAFPAVREEPD